MRLLLIVFFWVGAVVAYEAWTGQSLDFASYAIGVLVTLSGSALKGRAG